jgi:hypothetical protein
MSGRAPLLRRALRRARDVMVGAYRISMAAVGFYLICIGIGYVYDAGWYWLALLIGWPLLGFVFLVWALYEGGNVGPGHRR